MCLFLAGLTALTFLPLKSHDFLNYDDNEYVTHNEYVQAGLSWQKIRWAFTSTVSNHWHPLTWLSHMLDCEMFGLNPAGHHLMNLLLHILNTVLLFLILVRSTGTIWPATFTAVLFALHPLHVESVAWVAERKDTLSMCFWLLTMAAYFWYVKRPGLLRYLLTLVLFALGLMAKPMLVTLPVILLLMDFWPLERITLSRSATAIKQPAADKNSKSVSLFKICLEKIPFLVLAAVSSGITFLVMKRGGHLAGVTSLVFKYRLANVFVSYLGYITRMFWPVRLAPFYPHPGSTLPLWQPAVAALLLLSLSVAAFYYGRRHRYLLVGWLWYLVAFLPVIGLLQVGSQAMADRYTYVPLVGLFIIISFGTTVLFEKLRYGKLILLISYGLLTVVLAVCTFRQLAHWRNSITLFEHTIRVTSKNYLAHNNLANALGRKGMYDLALEHGLEAIRIRYNYDLAHYNVAMIYYHKDDLEKAISHWTEALKLNPGYAEAHYNIAISLIKQNHPDRALDHLRKELALNPRHARASLALYTLLKDREKNK